MKRILLSALAVLLTCGAFAAPADSLYLRSNYRQGGMTHISPDYQNLSLGGIPAQLRVELAGFPDGSALYLLYINLTQKEALNVPKGVKMGVTLTSGKVIRLDQIGQDSATKRRLENGLFLNRLKYAVETADMEKMIRGIKALDIITGFNPEDYINASFPADELSSLLRRQCEAIKDGASSTIELRDSLSGYTNNANSILANASPVVGRGSKYDYNILLSHLYYKNTNEEDLDLAFVIGTSEQFHVPFDAPVRFILRDGSTLGFLQARDDVNFVYVYPEIRDLQRMAAVGIERLEIDYEGGTLTDTFPVSEAQNGFSDAVNQQLQLLLSLSPR